jgi:homoserine kinase
MGVKPFTVRVPATTANLGPGFDAIGATLGLSNTVEVEAAARPELQLHGEGAEVLEPDDRNLVYRTLAAAAHRLGEPPPGVRLRCNNAIPLARGLGSSSAAIVAGLLVAGRLFPERLSLDALLDLGVQLEGHPDNVTPALLGGVQVTIRTATTTLHATVELPRPLDVVLFIPTLQMPTAAARAVLPPQVPFPDAVFNVGRASLLVAALARGDYTLLAEATKDRLHQPARAALFPQMTAFFEAALAAGACGAWLSGAGSTLLAVAVNHSEPVADAWQATARRLGVEGQILRTALGGPGAEVLE